MHGETPGETVFFAFGAVVVSGGDRCDAGDAAFFFEGNEAIVKGLCLGLGDAVFEFEENDVFDHVCSLKLLCFYFASFFSMASFNSVGLNPPGPRAPG